MSDSLESQFDALLAIDSSVLSDTASPGFGIGPVGFVAKPFARLLAEKLALARAILGDSVDLGSGSPVRKILEISALEDARGWATAAAVYDDLFVPSARGPALGRLGEELGLPRPYESARGQIVLKLTGDLPAGTTSLTIPRGARLLTSGGHHVSLTEAVVLSPDQKQQTAPVEAFYPGPEHNLDPSVAEGTSFPQKIDRWYRDDPKLAGLNVAEVAAHRELVAIDHSEALTGGDRQWPDVRYRQLLLRAPRSVWTVAAVELAVSLVPGVRQVQVQDRRGGLDLQQSIFGNFNFFDRVFSAERDLSSPYYFTILVAPTPSAIWSGVSGLRASIEQAVADLRPIGIFPNIREAQEISVGVSADLVVRGLPLPTGPSAVVNASAAARDLRARLHARLERYLDSIAFGEPVRVSEIVFCLMSEPGIVDARDVRLLSYPAEPIPATDPKAPAPPANPVVVEAAAGANLELGSEQVPVYVAFETPPRLRIV
jgi:hypothetical protein